MKFLLTIFANAVFTLALIAVFVPGAFDSSVQSGSSSQKQAVQISSQTESQNVVTDIVAQANPAVLSIVVSAEVPVYERFMDEFSPFGGLFGRGFGFSVPRERLRGTEEREIGQGSGFVVNADGLVVTNRHVVETNFESAVYSAFDSEGNRYELDLVAVDTVLDIAVLELADTVDLPFLEFANSDEIMLGQTAIAIGNALGEFSNSVSVGVVSGLSRSIMAGSGRGGDTETLRNVIQTDAAINPGNSGGPLLDATGKVIGVNVAVAQGSENIGFSLPANEVQRIVSSIEQTGEIVRPYLGVRYVTLNPERAEELGLEYENGAFIIGNQSGMSVIPDSPADKAGLSEGDVIVSIGEQTLNEDLELADVIQNLQVGDVVEMEVITNAQSESASRQVIEVILEKRPSE